MTPAGRGSCVVPTIVKRRLRSAGAFCGRPDRQGMGRMNTLSRCTRAASLGAAAFALVAALPAQAQFGFSFGGGKKKDVQTVEGCPQGQKKSVGASILGSIAKSAAGRVGGKFPSFVPLPEFADV